MEPLARQRCLQHSERQAVARCPECTHFYCRECITEHDDRVVCASCLKKLVKPAGERRIRLAGLGQFAQVLAGFVIIWLFFYWCGAALVAIPAKFHDGTFWNRNREDSP